MFKKLITKRGFTLLEILLVVGIIAVLAGIVIIAINPSKQLATVRNTQRKSNLAEINKAVQQYYIDNSTYPGGTSLVSTLTEICNTGAIPATTTSVTGAPCGTLTNLSDLVPTYLVAIPVDPQGSPVALFTNVAEASTLGTGYQIMKDANNKIALNSQGAELGAVITLGPITVSTPSTLGNGLVAHYLMNDTGATTTVIDSKGGSNGTAIRSVSVLTSTGYSSSTGGVNGALSFDGSNDKILLNSNFGLGGQKKMSVSLWLNGIPTAGFKGIFTDTTDNAVDLVIGYDVANIYFSMETGDGAIASGPVNRTGWHHLVATKSDTEVRMYYDGVEVGNSPQSNTTNIPSENFILGLDRSASGRYYQGAMDDVRIYNRDLTQAEITQLAAGTEAE